MAASSPSIQAFFTSPSKQLAPDSASNYGTCPTTSIPASTPDKHWEPEVDYQDVEIGSIVPGPACIRFTARIANFYNQPMPSKMPQSAKGCIKMVVKDDTGVCTVRLWYRDQEPKVRLGHLISIWTPHVSHNATGKLAVASAPLFISIFPEGDRSCHMMVHQIADNGTLYKRPLDHVKGETIPGLMTLTTYITGGHEMNDVKLQLCVKSIGPRMKVMNKVKVQSELLNIHVFDDTAEASITLWGDALHSADSWVPSETILLITRPQVKIDRRTYLSLNSNSLVDVDPDTDDARWLRKHAQRMKRREHVNPWCPEGVFNLQTALTQDQRILFTLADLDEWVRNAPDDTFTGFLSVVILEMNIASLYMRNMLLCTECCGIPLYSNDTHCICRNCNTNAPLRLNPCIVGTLVDETGCLASGKLLWTPTAWEQLLGRTVEELSKSGSELLRYMDKRFAFLRLTLVVGWAREELCGGRLCVLGVRM